MKLGKHYPSLALNELKLPTTSTINQSRKVSIVVPSFNQGQYLESTLKSIINQSYKNIQLIVVDGGSTDNSVNIIKQYERHIDWWVSEPDEGQTHAINKGFEKASGDVMAWLNSDDLFLPGAVGAAVDKLSSSKKPDVVYGQRILIDEQGQNIGQWVVSNSHGIVLPYADYIPQETLFWTRKAWESIGGQLDQSFQFAMDWDLLLRFKQQGLKFALINRFMGAFRFHPEQKTVAAIEHTGFADMERLRNRWAKELGQKTYSKRKMKAALIIFLLKTRMKEAFWKFGVFGNE